MTQDTFWSDTMQVCLSDQVESSIDAPEALSMALAEHLAAQGLTITRMEESNPGTKRIHPHKEIFLATGANPSLVTYIESFLSSSDVRFTKHEIANEPDHIDLSYDLDNVSVWK